MIPNVIAMIKVRMRLLVLKNGLLEIRHLGRYSQVCHHFKLDLVCVDMMAIVHAAIAIRMYVEGSGTVIGLNAREAGCVPVLQDVRKLPEESNLLIVFSTQFVA